MLGRPLLVVAVFACSLFAQIPGTQITDMIYDGAGQPVTGSCTYRLASGRATGSDGSQISGEPVTVRFTNGVFSAVILPTDTMTDVLNPLLIQSYSVSCSGSRGWAKSGFWTVATSGTALRLQDLWTTPAPTPPILIPPPQIDARGKPTATYCLDVTNGVVTGLSLCAGGSGGGDGTWGGGAGSTSTWGGD